MNTAKVLTCLFFLASTYEWGFFGHRKINELAVYTLPVEMKVFFSPNQAYFSRHAIDADKRRYASSFEAPRHYIDLDQYGAIPFDTLSRDFRTDLRNHCLFFLSTTEGETIEALPDSICETPKFKIWFDTLAMDFYYEEQWLVPLDLSFRLDTSKYRIQILDEFTEHGILPYNILRVYRKLVNAFKDLDATGICRYGSDLGHYIGDATVPLHTSSNYNGQKTDQYGIHAFWESRLPEQFAMTYDEWVGAAVYIDDIQTHIWNILVESHLLVDELLTTEQQIRLQLDDELEYGVEERNGRLISTQSDTLTMLYHEALDGMIEERYRSAIHCLGSFWYSAWVDAGMPNLEDVEPAFETESRHKNGRFITRRRHFE